MTSKARFYTKISARTGGYFVDSFMTLPFYLDRMFEMFM